MKTVVDQAEIGRPISIPRNSCRCCGASGNQLHPILDLGEMELARFSEPGTEASVPRAPLKLIACLHCGLIQLADTTDPDLLFKEFWYRTGINKSMRIAIADLVSCTTAAGYSTGRWLDIGANDGYLLSVVPASFTKFACEPAANFRKDLLKIADQVHSDYFREGMVERCDVITTAAMFYDLDNPHPFLHAIKQALAPNGLWVNQLNDSPRMLMRTALDAICHEHLCYYDAYTLRELYRQHGLEVVNITFNEVNGGSMRVFAKHAGQGRPGDFAGVRRPVLEDMVQFADRARRWRELTRNVIGSFLGGLWAYGASTKGTMLMQYLGMSDSFVAVADLNPLKHGLVMSGSHLPVVSEAEMRKAKPHGLMVLPWAFRNEFIEREAPLRAAGTPLIFPLPNLEIVL